MQTARTSEQKTIAIVGGGITGLTTAYYLQEEIKANQLPYQIKLLEASNRLGGKINTIKKDGYVIERGADSFLGRKKPAVRLAENLGLQEELIRNTTGQSYILINDRLHRIPKGFYMGIPTAIQPLLESDLFSLKGKLRASLDYIIPHSNAVGDQSLGYFLRRRFGNELVENSIEPLLSGIYSSDIDQMSLLATFPNLYELERSHKSLMKGLQETRTKPKAQTGKTPGQFFTFQHGLETFIHRLSEVIDEDVIALNKQVQQIKYTNHQYNIRLQDEKLEADVVIMTTPHQVLPKVFSAHPTFQSFAEIPSTSVANVALAFDESAVEQTLDGTGFVVSRNSDYRITACTWTHRKWEHTTPEGKVLLRAYVGKPVDQEVVQLSDDEIIGIVLSDLRKTMRITKEPELALVTRWKGIMPQYTVGHKARIQRVRRQLKEQLPGTFIAGSSYEGVGVPDCIGQAERVVEQTLAYLNGEKIEV